MSILCPVVKCFFNQGEGINVNKENNVVEFFLGKTK